MSGSEKGIVIILFQYSVVVKGMERKLTEDGYHVEIQTGQFHLIPKLTGNTDLFLIYLPGDILEESAERKNLEIMCDTILKAGKKVIILGEKKNRSELSHLVPVVDSCFWLDRPVDNDTLSSTVKKALKGELTGAKRVLIVDDDPSYATMVREWIKDHYRVEVVNAGMQAITTLLKDPMDLVLLDYEMPVVDGPQVLQMLRQDEITKDIPVIFLTGVGTKEGVERVMALHPAGYVLKNTTRDNLLSVLRHKLG